MPRALRLHVPGTMYLVDRVIPVPRSGTTRTGGHSLIWHIVGVLDSTSFGTL